MPPSLALIELIRFFVDLFSMSVAIGLIFVVLLTHRRNGLTYAFSAFALSLFLWSTASFIRFSPLNDLIAPQVTMAIFNIVLFTKTIAFYAFSLFAVRTIPRWIRYLTYAGIPYCLFVAWLILSDSTFSYLSEDSFTYTISTLAYIALAIAIFYLCIAFYLVSQSQEKTIRHLRFPTFFMISFYLVNAIPLFNNVPLDTLLTLITIIWMGTLVVQRQLLNPIENLNAELEHTNRNLQKAITDLKREKFRVENLNQDLTNANHYKSEFVATMNHELRTPLNSIIGYSDLLLEESIYGELNDSQRDRLQRIRRNGQHLARLINAVLDLNRLDAGQVELYYHPLNIHELFARLEEQYYPHAHEKNITLQNFASPDLPHVPADLNRFEQILANIVDNAIKFTDSGSVELHADVLRVTNGVGQLPFMPTQGWLADGEWLLCRIIDTGIGIPQEMQSTIFDRFYQIDSGHARAYEGIGLGLAISTRLVEMHKGKIWLDSQPKSGTTILVAIPLTNRN